MLTMTAAPTVRAFRSEDLAAIVNRDGQQIPQAVLMQQACAGPAWTAVVDDRPIGCAGVVMPWPGVGMAWMVLSEEIERHGIWLCKTVVAFLSETVNRHGLHRVEAVALVDSPRNQRWLSRMGFHVEQHGVARHFLADCRSVVRYEWIKE